MQSQQIYAAIELSDSLVKLIVGKFSEKRLNIIYSQKLPMQGLQAGQIINKQLVLESIQNILNDFNSKFEIAISSLIVSLSAINTYVKEASTQVFANGDKNINLQTIQEVYNNFFAMKLENKVIVSLTNFVYNINGLFLYKMPLNEKFDILTVSCDIIYLDDSYVYPILMLFDELGISVLNINLDALAIAEESSVLRQSNSDFTVLADVQASFTRLHLFHKNRFIDSSIINFGIDYLITEIQKVYQLDYYVIEELIRLHLRFSEDNSREIIYFDQNYSFSAEDLYQIVKNTIAEFVYLVNYSCKNIFDAGLTNLVFIQDFASYAAAQDLKNLFNINCAYYIPSNLGARDASYTNLLGQLYLWLDQKNILNNLNTSIDNEQLTRLINQKLPKNKNLNFTSKLKRVFK